MTMMGGLSPLADMAHLRRASRCWPISAKEASHVSGIVVSCPTDSLATNRFRSGFPAQTGSDDRHQMRQTYLLIGAIAAEISPSASHDAMIPTRVFSAAES